MSGAQIAAPVMLWVTRFLVNRPILSPLGCCVTPPRPRLNLGCSGNALTYTNQTTIFSNVQHLLSNVRLRRSGGDANTPLYSAFGHERLGRSPQRFEAVDALLGLCLDEHCDIGDDQLGHDHRGNRAVERADGRDRYLAQHLR